MPEQETLDAKDTEILLLAAFVLSYDVQIFADRLRQEIERLTRNGVSEQSIVGILDTDLRSRGRIFGELSNSIKRGVVGGINQAFRRAGDVGSKLKWVAISKNICDDCSGRAGALDTWDGWGGRGMPGSGWSVCKEYCYCQLIPEEIEIDDNLTI